jgi:hypothetical protein
MNGIHHGRSPGLGDLSREGGDILLEGGVWAGFGGVLAGSRSLFKALFEEELVDGSEKLIFELQGLEHRFDAVNVRGEGGDEVFKRDQRASALQPGERALAGGDTTVAGFLDGLESQFGSRDPFLQADQGFSVFWIDPALLGGSFDDLVSEREVRRG